MYNFKEVKISEIFDVKKGKSIYTNTYISKNIGIFPVFSSQTTNDGEIGKIQKYDYNTSCITWTTDGIHAGTVFLRKNLKFSMTTHCGALILKSNYEKINLDYIYYFLKNFLKINAIGTDNKRITNGIIKNISIKIPIDKNGEFDFEKQKEIVYKYEKLEKIKNKIRDIKEDLENKETEIIFTGYFKEYNFEEIFNLDIKTNSSKFTKTFVNLNKGNIPVYSASKDENVIGYGYIKDNIEGIKYFENCLTWNIDGSVGKAFVRKGKFSLSEKVIPLVLNENYKNFNLYYLKYIIEIESQKEGFSFSKKAGKSRIKNISIKIPIDKNGKFDLEKQKEISSKYEKIYKIKQKLLEELEYLEKVKVEF